MLDTQFDEDLALMLLESDKEFPVEFNKAWEWLGFYDKPTAKRSLLSCNFEPGLTTALMPHCPL
jgi:anti-repressor protein